eukprot:UN04472
MSLALIHPVPIVVKSQHGADTDVVVLIDLPSLLSEFHNKEYQPLIDSTIRGILDGSIIIPKEFNSFIDQRVIAAAREAAKMNSNNNVNNKNNTEISIDTITNSTDTQTDTTTTTIPSLDKDEEDGSTEDIVIDDFINSGVNGNNTTDSSNINSPDVNNDADNNDNNNNQEDSKCC